MLEIDPQDYLFSALQTWPTPSRTAETLLVRREGDEVVFLNDLRHQADTSLKLRISISQHPELIAAKAVTGEAGLLTGLDYREVPVFAAVRQVPDSPWSVIAKQDQVEVFAPLRKQGWMLAGIGMSLMAAALTGGGYFWRNRERLLALDEVRERQQAEEVLRVSERKLQEAQRVARIGSYELDITTGRWSSSAMLDEIFGIADPAFQRDTAGWLQAVHPLDRETLSHYLAFEVIGARKPFDYEYRIQRLNTGEERWVHGRGELGFDASGKPVKMIGSIQDVTERKRTDEALQKRVVALTQPLDATTSVSLGDLFDMEALQAIQDAFAAATGVASVITDTQGTPLTRPSNFCRLCKDVIRGTEKGRANCFRSDAVIGRHHREGPIIQCCLSGGLLDAGASITVGGVHVANWLIGQVRNEAVNTSKMLEYAKEIGADPVEFGSALEEVTLMPKERFDAVAHTLFLLSKELSLKAYQNMQQARFIADRQRAEEERERLMRTVLNKNRELESIIYVASHDLRSPLLNIQGFSRRIETAGAELDKLLATPGTPTELQTSAHALLRERMNPSLGIVQGSVRKMDRLLNGLLRLSRLGRSAIRIEPLDMDRLVGSVLESLSFQIQEAGACFEVGGLPTCCGDSVQMAQVFTNLIDNAIKYRDPARPLLVRINGEMRGAESIYCVEDNGIGISPDHCEKVWEVFHRLDPDGPVGGEGLGLSIVMRILDRHDGRAWVEGTAGSGCRFFVALPTHCK
jgi:signal transduction histidine kinase/PAS domain-containing protein